MDPSTPSTGSTGSTASSATRPRRLPRTLIAGASALLLAGSLATLTACGGGDDTTPPGVIRVYGSEPQHPLIPTNTNETGGGDILRYLFTGLTQYDNDGTMEMAHAKSITANSNSTQFTITLKPGWIFSNGEPVTAQSYVDAWNYGACGKNLQLNQASLALSRATKTSSPPTTPTATCGASPSPAHSASPSPSTSPKLASPSAWATPPICRFPASPTRT